MYNIDQDDNTIFPWVRPVLDHEFSRGGIGRAVRVRGMVACLGLSFGGCCSSGHRVRNMGMLKQTD